MKKQMLQNPYIAVRTDSGRISYGGDQSWLSTDVERSFGCGLIASADILRYLRRKCRLEQTSEGKDILTETVETVTAFTGNSIGKQEYLEDIRELSKDFRIRGKLGITGFGLARRMNRIFRRENLPYRSKWSIGKRRLERRLPEMLEADIPVLLSVGPGFFHTGQRLSLYRSKGEGVYERENSMRDHYVTVTGRLSAETPATAGRDSGGTEGGKSGGTDARQRIEAGEDLLRISSWGEEYYIRYDEYIDHVKKYDNFLFSSILYIRRKG
ncbi:MAG: hypothetical protein IJM25_10080 [Eubacterium sp.]|nr:hypothetical protein [Eubacterium sp.]